MILIAFCQDKKLVLFMEEKEMERNYEINTRLGLYEYINMANQIALEYFDDDGTYQPHIGKINAMRLFYNNCVVKSKFDDVYDHNITSSDDLVDILADDDFIIEFEDAIRNHGAFSFGAAYDDALDMVYARKSSIGSVIDALNRMLKKLNDKLSDVLSDENVEQLSKIAQNISDGGITAEDIVNAYSDKLPSLDKDEDKKE